MPPPDVVLVTSRRSSSPEGCPRHLEGVLVTSQRSFATSWCGPCHLEEVLITLWRIPSPRGGPYHPREVPIPSRRSPPSWGHPSATSWPGC